MWRNVPPAGYFLVPNKKVTKEVGIRGASGKCAPLCIPRRFDGVAEKTYRFLLQKIINLRPAEPSLTQEKPLLLVLEVF